MPIETLLLLHSATFRLDFVVEEMAQAQLGLGFLLAFDDDLYDWGFFGYLGVGNYAWSYDPSSGDVVNATESIEGGLPFFQDGQTGLVTLELELPRTAEGRARFRTQGKRSRDIALPPGAVVKPAGCLLREGQRMTLRPLQSD